MTRLVGVLREAMVWTGAGLIAYGAWSAYRPAGFIVGGLFVFAIGVVGEIRGAKGSD